MKEREQHQSVYEITLKKILEGIDRGDYLINERLPSERYLAEQLGVSRGSLREALRVLERQHIIATRSDGRYIISTTVQDKIEKNSLYKDLEQAKLADLIEARIVLEDKIVELACKRATKDDLNAIKECIILSLQSDIKNADIDALNSDNLFHLSIARAAHNSVFLNVYNTNMELLQIIRGQSLRSEERRKEIKLEHQNIFDAISARDVLMARLAVRIHLRSISQQYLRGFRQNHADIDTE